MSDIIPTSSIIELARSRSIAADRNRVNARVSIPAGRVRDLQYEFARAENPLSSDVALTNPFVVRERDSPAGASPLSAGIRGEETLPRTMTEYDHRMRAQTNVFVGGEHASTKGAHAEHVEVVRRHHDRSHDFRRSVCRDAHKLKGGCGDDREYTVRSIAQIEVVWNRAAVEPFVDGCAGRIAGRMQSAARTNDAHRRLRPVGGGPCLDFQDARDVCLTART